jgi:hypothetical protein
MLASNYLVPRLNFPRSDLGGLWTIKIRGILRYTFYLTCTDISVDMQIWTIVIDSQLVLINFSILNISCGLIRIVHLSNVPVLRYMSK